MADTRRQLFKSSVLSALGVLSFATVVKAAGSRRAPQDSILLRVDNNTTYLFETRADGVHVFEVTPPIATAASVPDVDGTVYDGKHQLKKRMSKISFGKTYTINVQDGVVTDDPPLGGLLISRAQWAEINGARAGGQHRP